MSKVLHKVPYSFTRQRLLENLCRGLLEAFLHYREPHCLRGVGELNVILNAFRLFRCCLDFFVYSSWHSLQKTFCLGNVLLSFSFSYNGVRTAFLFCRTYVIICQLYTLGYSQSVVRRAVSQTAFNGCWIARSNFGYSNSYLIPCRERLTTSKP